MTRFIMAALAAFFVACGSANAQTCKAVGALPTLQGGDHSPLLCTLNGELYTSGGGGGGGGTSSNFAAAFPAAGTAIGVRDASGNMAPWRAYAVGSGGTVETVAGVRLTGTGEGGAGATVVELGTLANPIVTAPAKTQHGTAVPATTNGAYDANDSIGGLLTIQVYPTASNISSTLALLTVKFKGATAKTPSLRIHVWERNIVNSTCTNNNPVVLDYAGAGDDYRYYLGTYSITPVVNNVASQTTIGSVELAVPITNRDTPSGVNIYVCVETLSAVTLQSTSDMIVHARAGQ